MRKFATIIVAAGILSAGALFSTAEAAGCYRLGETGYHWYRSCFGPHFLYPHHRVCHEDGYCYYR